MIFRHGLKSPQFFKSPVLCISIGITEQRPGTRAVLPRMHKFRDSDLQISTDVCFLHDPSEWEGSY